jgi:hypothetical protein
MTAHRAHAAGDRDDLLLLRSRDMLGQGLGQLSGAADMRVLSQDAVGSAEALIAGQHAGIVQQHVDRRAFERPAP